MGYLENHLCTVGLGRLGMNFRKTSELPNFTGIRQDNLLSFYLLDGSKEISKRLSRVRKALIPRKVLVDALLC